MGTYDSAIALAKRLIEKKGGPTILTKLGAATPADPDKPWLGEAPPAAPKTFKAVFLPFDFKGSEPKKFADGTLVQVGAMQVYAAAASLGAAYYPGLNDTLTRADKSVWVIKTVKPLDPNGEQILFELWVTQ